nr:uncharacterized protein LOC128694258 [Cherax quadricarinatus]
MAGRCEVTSSNFHLGCLTRALSPANMSERNISFLKRVKKVVFHNKRALRVCAVTSAFTGAGYYFYYRPHSQALSQKIKELALEDSEAATADEEMTNQSSDTTRKIWEENGNLP